MVAKADGSLDAFNATSGQIENGQVGNPIGTYARQLFHLVKVAIINEPVITN